MPDIESKQPVSEHVEKFERLACDVFSSGRRYYQKHQDKKVNRKNIRTRIDSFSAQELVPSVETDGENRLRNFLQRFTDGFRFQNKPLRFEKFQLKFIDMVAPVLAPNIVGPQWTAIGPRLSREFGWPLKRMPRVMLGQAPRRFGKTVSLGAIMLNYALEVAGCIQSAFSTSKRASQKLKAKVAQMCTESGLDAWVYRSCEEQLYLKDPENPLDIIRQMNFYPANKVSFNSCIIVIFYIDILQTKLKNSKTQKLKTKKLKKVCDFISI